MKNDCSVMNIRINPTLMSEAATQSSAKAQPIDQCAAKEKFEYGEGPTTIPSELCENV